MGLIPDRLCTPHATFRRNRRRDPQDIEYATVVAEPNGVRDFQLVRFVEHGCFEALNPLELLDTRTAVMILEKLRQTDGANPNGWALSRLLVQCLEYSRNRRHLISESWDEEMLRGEYLTKDSQGDFARDLQREQARLFRLVRESDEESLEPDADYWGTFTPLPAVPDQFEDGDLDKLADQLLHRITDQLDETGSVELMPMRRTIAAWWQEYFDDFDLPVRKRERRNLFKKLMSVAVRQASSMTERIAFTMVLRDANAEDRERGLFRNEAERKLFNLRYGACEALGNINIGFLYDCGERHAELINNLASSFVSGSEDAWQAAERELQEEIYLLGSAREKARQVEANRKRERRQQRAANAPGPTVSPNNQPDPRPTGDSETLLRLRDRRDRVLAALESRPRDHTRLRAFLDHDGDYVAAAESLGLDAERFRRQFLQTTMSQVSTVVEQLDGTNNEN